MKRVFLLLLLACCLLIAPAAAAGGAGTAANPYIIETPAELQSISNNLAAYYVLGNDIDMQGYSFTTIGSSSAPFIGSIDGAGHTIKNLKIIHSAGNENNAFIHTISSNGVIKNIIFDTCYVSGNQYSAIVISRSNAPSGNNPIYLQDITIKNSKVESSNIAANALLIGLSFGETNLNIVDCLVQDSILVYSGTQNGNGGIIGGVSGSSSIVINNCICENVLLDCSGLNVGIIGGQVYDVDLMTVTNCDVINCLIDSNGSSRSALLLGQCFPSASVSIDSCTVSKSSIYSSSTEMCGITYTNNPNTVISNCLVKDSVIYASTAAYGISNNGIITNCDVDNTNIYATSSYDIGPSGIYDSTSTATGITNVAGRYLYASGLTATPNGATVSYTLEGQQGSTTVEATQGTAQSWAWTFGDGQTSTAAQDTTHTYAAPGTYSTSLTLKNYLDSTGVTVTTSGYNILPIPPTVSASANVLQLGQSTTLSAVGTLFSTIQWQHSTNSGATWQDISGATTATYEWTPTAGVYQVRAHVSDSITGYTATSNTVSLTVYAPPEISAVSASPQQGPLQQAVVLSATVTDPNSGPTYQWQEYASGSWVDIAGATTNPMTVQVNDGAATLHRYRLAATGLGGTAYSGEVSYQSVAPPVFSAFEVSPLSGGIPLQVSFSAAASDTVGYRWEYSTDGTIWVQMASGASGSYTFTQEGVYYIRVVATGTGGSTTSASATITASDLLPEFTEISVSPAAGVAPYTVTLTAAATNSPTFVWERQTGSTWTQIGTGATVSYTIPSGTPVGDVYFRAIATNLYGSVISQVVAAEVGAPPVAEITSPAAGSVFGSARSISFAAADAGADVSYSWDFGDGLSGSGRTLTHSYSEPGFYTVTLTVSSVFGSSSDLVRIEIVEATGDIWLAVSDVSTTGADLLATVEVSPVSAGTVVWFEVSTQSGQVVLRSGEIPYTSPVTFEASGLPLMSGQTYRATVFSNNYGYSIPVMFTLIDAVQQPHETLGTEWENGLSRDPFNVSLLVSSGIAVFGDSMGGGSVGAAVAFGVIVMFVLVGLWLRQQDVVIPLTLTLVAGWFVIGNLPGEWQPIAYTLMVVAVVAIFFYLFRKRIE